MFKPLRIECRKCGAVLAYQISIAGYYCLPCGITAEEHEVVDDVKQKSHGPDVHAEVDVFTDEMHKRQALRDKLTDEMYKRQALRDKAKPKTATEIMNEQRADTVEQKARHSTNVVELSGHNPTVESVINRLVRHQDQIKNLVVFIEYGNKQCQVAYNTQSTQSLAYSALAVTHSISKVVFEELDNG